MTARPNTQPGPHGEAGDELTSLTSFDLTPYPAPLSQAAFYGLAGQFVERVLPNTESDEAALLFQFHTCFWERDRAHGAHDRRCCIALLQTPIWFWLGQPVLREKALLPGGIT